MKLKASNLASLHRLPYHPVHSTQNRSLNIVHHMVTSMSGTLCPHVPTAGKQKVPNAFCVLILCPEQRRAKLSSSTNIHMSMFANNAFVGVRVRPLQDYLFISPLVHLFYLFPCSRYMVNLRPSLFGALHYVAHIISLLSYLLSACA